MNNLVCYLDFKDNFGIIEKHEKCSYDIQNNNYASYFEGHIFKTGTKSVLSEMYNLPEFFNYKALDLYYISVFIYYADCKFSRKDSFDNWKRDIKLYVPVLNYSLWKENKNLLEKMINFLTGDKWTIIFRKRELSTHELKLSEKFTKKCLFDYGKKTQKKVTMLSGGLDSFIGAIDNLERSRDILFVSYYDKASLSTLIKIQDILANQYKINKSYFYNFYLSVKKRNESTTRSRSLLFFSTAVLIGSTYDSTNLIIPENGFISLNVPLVPYRSGSNSTRTTHPLYIEYFNNLLKSIKINITMSNPYQFKTKGSMMIECENQKLLINHAIDTMSCSHPKVTRFYNEPPMNCGYCLPCIVRKGAFKKSKIKDDKYLGDKHDIKKFKTNLDTYKRGIYEFDTKNNHATTVIKNGRIPGSVEKYVNVYMEGMKEIKEIIKEMK